MRALLAAAAAAAAVVPVAAWPLSGRSESVLEYSPSMAQERSRGSRRPLTCCRGLLPIQLLARRSGLPGERVKLRRPTRKCRGVFRSYVGIPYSQSMFAKRSIVPGPSEWVEQLITVSGVLTSPGQVALRAHSAAGGLYLIDGQVLLDRLCILLFEVSSASLLPVYSAQALKLAESSQATRPGRLGINGGGTGEQS